MGLEPTYADEFTSPLGLALDDILIARIMFLSFDGQFFIQVEIQTIFLFDDDNFQAAIIRPAMDGSQDVRASLFVSN